MAEEAKKHARQNIQMVTDYRQVGEGSLHLWRLCGWFRTTLRSPGLEGTSYLKSVDAVCTVHVWATSGQDH